MRSETRHVSLEGVGAVVGITGSALSGTLVDLGNLEEAAIELSQGAVGRALDNPLVAIFGGGLRWHELRIHLPK